MSQQPPDRSTISGPARPEASMSLLTNLVDHSLDDGYAEAAARRGAGGRSGLPRSVRAKLGLAAGLVLAALVVTVGAAQARVDAPILAKERLELVDRIEDGTAQADVLQKRVDTLRGTVEYRQARALREPGGDRDGLVPLLSGATPVEGPGVELVIDDAKRAGQDGSGAEGSRVSSDFSDNGRVLDRDLQRVINGLWESGAEAVSVNGQRLTGLSAIRAAGEAILVDNRPLVPPYSVLAVGDGKQLRAAFQDSADGQYLSVLRAEYGIRTSMSTRSKVELPAAPSLIIRMAEPVRTGKGAS